MWKSGWYAITHANRGSGWVAHTEQLMFEFGNSHSKMQV